MFGQIAMDKSLLVPSIHESGILIVKTKPAANNSALKQANTQWPGQSTGSQSKFALRHFFYIPPFHLPLPSVYRTLGEATRHGVYCQAMQYARHPGIITELEWLVAISSTWTLEPEDYQISRPLLLSCRNLRLARPCRMLIFPSCLAWAIPADTITERESCYCEIPLATRWNIETSFGITPRGAPSFVVFPFLWPKETSLERPSLPARQ